MKSISMERFISKIGRMSTKKWGSNVEIVFYFVQKLSVRNPNLQTKFFCEAEMGNKIFARVPAKKT